MGKRRIRKRHVQLDLLNKDGSGRGDTRVGKHRGGRPIEGARRAAGHRRRLRFKPNQPVHVVLRVVPEIGNLRQRLMYAAIQRATIAAAKQTDARIVEISIQRTHIHLIVEATDASALTRLIQGFGISAAKLLNHAHAEQRGIAQLRRGRVFADRYHASVITSPRQMRNTLAYVLNNWRKHGEDTSTRVRKFRVDPFSSAPQSRAWETDERSSDAFPKIYRPLHVKPARTWLARVGWRKHGAIRHHEVPDAA